MGSHIAWPHFIHFAQPIRSIVSPCVHNYVLNYWWHTQFSCVILNRSLSDVNSLIMLGHPVITAHLCRILPPCIVPSICAFLLSSHIEWLNCRQFGSGAEVWYGHFGTSAKLFGQFGRICLESWCCRSVLGPNCLGSKVSVHLGFDSVDDDDNWKVLTLGLEFVLGKCWGQFLTYWAKQQKWCWTELLQFRSEGCISVHWKIHVSLIAYLCDDVPEISLGIPWNISCH